jgi:cardiolipin synthase
MTQLMQRDSLARPSVRELADQAFSRAAGASLIEGNCVILLKDAQENYPAWLKAIQSAKHYIHFESYIIHEDDSGWMFADALTAKAREGVRVRLLYDWMGGFGKTSRSFWNHLRAAGVEVRCYNAPRFDSPLGWLSRDHRKTLTIDGQVGFVTGLCVGRMWVGVPEKKIEPWRDTGVEVRGPAVSDIEHAFAQVWALTGEAISEDEVVERESVAHLGDVAVRIVATQPATAGMMRLDQLVAALARERLWLTDAYYAATSSYVQSLRAAARDGVDVRLLVPNGTDIPILRPLSRAGYRPLLEAGVRVFEWNGTMLHAKTAVADSKWARVGSTNLNVASWFGNLELDVMIEDESFARQMDHLYLKDLENATEIVLDSERKVRAPHEPPHPHPLMTSGGGSAGRAAAGALRITNTVGAAFTNRRVLEPVEARIMLAGGSLLLALAILVAWFPRVLVYPVVFVLVWIALALFYRGYRLTRSKDLPTSVSSEKADAVKGEEG